MEGVYENDLQNFSLKRLILDRAVELSILYTTLKKNW